MGLDSPTWEIKQRTKKSDLGIIFSSWLLTPDVFRVKIPMHCSGGVVNSQTQFNGSTPHRDNVHFAQQLPIVDQNWHVAGNLCSL